MAYIPKIFMETTVFNFYFEGKYGQKQKDAIRLFEAIAEGKYEAYVSKMVGTELERASQEKEKMLRLFNSIENVLFPSEEALRMADIYIAKGIIPIKYRDDAVHIATATINRLDFVISYNLGHIIKTKTMIGAGLANLREGYRQIGLSSPTEVLSYDR
jgi:predicted nucleic acid-binding protein